MNPKGHIQSQHQAQNVRSALGLDVALLGLGFYNKLSSQVPCILPLTPVSIQPGRLAE